MDALSDVLRIVQFNGAVYLDGTMTAPWCVVGRPDGRLFGGQLADGDRVVAFHYLTEGSCWAMLPGDRAHPLRVEAGDLLIVPQGEMHILGSATDLEPAPSAPLLAAQHRATPDDVLTVAWGGGGAATRMICGFLASDCVLGNPLLAALPRVFKVGMHGADTQWLTTSLRFAATEAARERAGGTSVLGKLSELMFIEAVRRYTEALPADRRGWLAGLRDRFVGRALTLLHARPAHPWTVDELGREVGLSRSALAQRFADLLGQPPIQYLAHWRLQIAARQLKRGDRPLAAIAEAVGYESEAAFNRAFKREFGMPPATWRRGDRPVQPTDPIA